ncbi:MAG: hypothetical protein NTV34_20390 [Proteobacteria bacterium]|nr:hypothetical protein [Pseudomonadota bacterium]
MKGNIFREHFWSILAILSVFSCKSGNQSGLEDVSIYENFRCLAEWACGGESEPRGRVRTSPGAIVTDDVTCKAELEGQLSKSNACALSKYTLVSYHSSANPADLVAVETGKEGLICSTRVNSAFSAKSSPLAVFMQPTGSEVKIVSLIDQLTDRGELQVGMLDSASCGRLQELKIKLPDKYNNNLERAVFWNDQTSKLAILISAKLDPKVRNYNNGFISVNQVDLIIGKSAEEYSQDLERRVDVSRNWYEVNREIAGLLKIASSPESMGVIWLRQVAKTVI